MKKIIIISFAFLTNINVFSQDDKTVTLVVSGSGTTQEVAKQNALRNAIEQAFGTFISSNTEILNDNLVKDEIVSVANGNIQKYEIIEEVQIPNGGYATTLKATVSLKKLTSFVESKGVVVEFKGSLFAFNINLQILNEKNEIKAIEDMCKIIKDIADTSFDYTITASEPKSLDNTNQKWLIPFFVSVFKNKNFEILSEYLFKNLQGLTLTKEEADSYIKLNKKIYPVSIAVNENKYSYIILRSEKSITELIKMLYYFNNSLQNFKISNGIEKWSIKDKPENLKYIYDNGFRIFLVDRNKKGSVFYLYECKAAALAYWESKGVKVPDYIDRVDRCGKPKNYKNWLDLQNYDKRYTLFDEDSFKTVFRISDGWAFSNQFSFIRKLQNELKTDNNLNKISGLVISFIPHYFEYKEYKKRKQNLQPKVNYEEDKEIVRFYFEDVKDINIINKISEYKVLPILY
jgi:hypothetical protein